MSAEASVSPIPGLRYLPGYLDAGARDRLLAEIDGQNWQSWQNAGGRRIQFYGHWSHHAKGGLYRVGDLPAWAGAVAARLRDDRLMPYLADQLIVTEYEPGQGIRPHIDAPVFEDVIVGLTLGSTCIMELTRPQHPTEGLLLEPGSALVLSGEARHEWQHAIPARAEDVWRGKSWPRSRRISLTFRRMLTHDS